MRRRRPTLHPHAPLRRCRPKGTCSGCHEPTAGHRENLISALTRGTAGQIMRLVQSHRDSSKFGDSRPAATSDAATFAILLSTFDSIADEMGENLVQSAHSTLIREA